MSKSLKAWVATVVALTSIIATRADATTLGDAATQLQSGQWRVLNQAGDSSGFNYSFIESCQPTTCADTIFNYADKGMWDPQRREIQFIGKGHLAELKHVSYSEASNSWSREAKPYWDCGRTDNCWSMGHGYEHTSMNPATGDVYARLMNSTSVYKWTRATKTWTQLPAAPLQQVANAIEYFPEMGGLLMFGQAPSGTHEIHIYRESTGTWSMLATGLAMGDYHNMARYDPVHRIVIGGGGNSAPQLYKVDATGRVTQIASAPDEVRILTNIWTVDPASGKYLLFSDGNNFHEYDPSSNAWRTLSAANVPIFDGSGNVASRIAIPISTYGVNAFLVSGGTSDTRVVLYRHAASAPPPPLDTTPPPAPASLTVR